MSEIFTALETDVVDGQENPYPTIYTSSFYEVQKYALESNHMFSPNFWIMNETFYQSLTDQEREAVDSSVKEAAEYNWEISQQADQDAKQSLIDNGVTVQIPDEAYKQALRDSQEPVYEWFFKEKEGSKEVVDAIRAYQADHPAQ
jgi:TRAP-type C4-dicarboxylate transport system substrate-binding protein